MTPLENTTSTIKGEHLSFKERCQIEAYKRLPKPLPNREIARLLQRVPQTINNEIKRGTTIQISRQTQNGKVYTYEHSVYLADVAQEKYDQARQHSHSPCLFSQNTAFIDYADEQMLVSHHSPDAIIGRAKKTVVSLWTKFLARRLCITGLIVILCEPETLISWKRFAEILSQLVAERIRRF